MGEDSKMKMTAKLAALIFLMLTACSSESETIIHTVEIPSTVEVSVTNEVTRQLGVTRLVVVS
jgi:uncharacterized lipoprotein YajG